jgi:2-dehydropantoate 2-reductase
MGLGSVGKWVAHSLKGIPNPPPVTLLFHNRSKLQEWEKSPRKLQVTTDGDAERREGFESELAVARFRFHGKEIGARNSDLSQEASDAQSQASQEPELVYGESDEPINTLILCMKSTQVLSALSAVKHRLHKESVICFLQNGMGTVEAVTQEIFPDPETRPHYMVGINSHGMHMGNDPFSVVHAGFGTIALGLLPNERISGSAPYAPVSASQAEGSQSTGEPAYTANSDRSVQSPTPETFLWTQNQRYLLRTLLRTPVFCATAFSPTDLLQLQLEKLAVNCIINPLTVMLDARNGSVLYNYHLTRVMRLLLSEIALVIHSLPELQNVPNVQRRFDTGRLESIVVGVANRTRDNISSMLADVRNDNETEIDYINGWIVKKGEELGIKCFMNYMITLMVKGKRGLIHMELNEGIPFVEARPGEGDIVIKDQSGKDVPLEEMMNRADLESKEPAKDV